MRMINVVFAFHSLWHFLEKSKSTHRACGREWRAEHQPKCTRGETNVESNRAADATIIGDKMKENIKYYIKSELLFHVSFFSFAYHCASDADV